MKICLIDMPFSSFEFPSHALSLLKTYLTQGGIDSTCLYLNLVFASQIGASRYDMAYKGDWAFISNICFARSAFGDDVTPLAEADGYAEQKEMQDECERFIEWCVDAYDWSQYDAFGFATAFSASTTAALALAKRLKAKFGKPVIFGGSGVFEIAGHEYVKVPWVDYVFTGQTGEAFVEFLKLIADGGDVSHIPGLCFKDAEGRIVMSKNPSGTDMDAVPIPDYSDYFEQIKQCPEEMQKRFEWLFIELGRGCYYGDKQTCTFCAEGDLNYYNSTYRSAENSLQYLRDVSARYPEHKKFFLTDSLIMPYVVQKVFPAWASERGHREYFAEVKPWMSRQDIRGLAEGGVILVQCGIESLHPNIIKLLRKSQKVHTCLGALKWFKTYNIDVYWNFLAVVPGEDVADYAPMVELCKKIRHFAAPQPRLSPVRVTRYSPYWNERKNFQFANLRPHDVYRFMVPHWLDVEKIAWTWEYDLAEGHGNLELFMPEHLALKEEIATWRAGPYELTLRPDSVLDSRSGTARIIPLTAAQRDILVYCDSARNIDQLRQYDSADLGYLLDNDLLLLLENKFFGLPIISDEFFNGASDAPVAQKSSGSSKPSLDAALSS